jgi:hypothetical protein
MVVDLRHPSPSTVIIAVLHMLHTTQVHNTLMAGAAEAVQTTSSGGPCVQVAVGGEVRPHHRHNMHIGKPNGGCKAGSQAATAHSACRGST